MGTTLRGKVPLGAPAAPDRSRQRSHAMIAVHKNPWGSDMHAPFFRPRAGTRSERSCVAAALAVAAAVAAPSTFAGSFAAPPKPPLGTTTVATADLLVKR